MTEKTTQFSPMNLIKGGLIAEKTTQFSPMNLIKGGLIAGGIYEVGAIIYRSGYYKSIPKFITKYPGVGLAIFTSCVGLSIMYKSVFSDIFTFGRLKK